MVCFPPDILKFWYYFGKAFLGFKEELFEE